jgi:orotate phosphoribosyltransferase
MDAVTGTTQPGQTTANDSTTGDPEHKNGLLQQTKAESRKRPREGRIWHIQVISLAVFAVFFIILATVSFFVSNWGISAAASILGIALVIHSVTMPIGLWFEEDAFDPALEKWKSSDTTNRGAMIALTLGVAILVVIAGVMTALHRQAPKAAEGAWVTAAPLAALLCGQLAYIAWAATLRSARRMVPQPGDGERYVGGMTLSQDQGIALLPKIDSVGDSEPEGLDIAQILTNSWSTELTCAILANKLRQYLRSKGERCDVVVAPAVGGVVLGYALAGQLGVKLVIVEVEKVDGEVKQVMARRGFDVVSRGRVVVVDDVVKSGATMRKCIEWVGPKRVAAAVCLVHEVNKDGQLAEVGPELFYLVQREPASSTAPAP